MASFEPGVPNNVGTAASTFGDNQITSTFGDANPPADASAKFRDQLMSENLQVLPRDAVQVAQVQAAPPPDCKDPRVAQTDQRCQQPVNGGGGWSGWIWLRSHVWSGHGSSPRIGGGPIVRPGPVAPRDGSPGNTPRPATVTPGAEVRPATVTPAPEVRPATVTPVQRLASAPPAPIESAPKASTSSPSVHSEGEAAHGSWGHASVGSSAHASSG